MPFWLSNFLIGSARICQPFERLKIGLLRLDTVVTLRQRRRQALLPKRCSKTKSAMQLEGTDDRRVGHTLPGPVSFSGYFSAVSAALLRAGIRSVVAMTWSLYVSVGPAIPPAFYRRLFETGNVARKTLFRCGEAQKVRRR
jgi:hypothetical protein